MSKFGIVLTWYLYNEGRKPWWAMSRDSLAQTILDRPVKMLVVHRPEVPGLPDSDIDALRKFDIDDRAQPGSTAGTDQSMAWGVEQLLEDKEIEYFVFLTDDLLYNRWWLSELKGLIERHPDARAWSVYRSAHEVHHATLGQIESDVRVRSLSGNGTCMRAQEWREWGIHWSQGPNWPVPTGGDTLDLLHPCQRPGDRWVTDKSYIQHIGKSGLRVTPAIPEYGQNWVGE